MVWGCFLEWLPLQESTCVRALGGNTSPGAPATAAGHGQASQTWALPTERMQRQHCPTPGCPQHSLLSHPWAFWWHWGAELLLHKQYSLFWTAEKGSLQTGQHWNLELTVQLSQNGAGTGKALLYYKTPQNNVWYFELQIVFHLAIFKKYFIFYILKVFPLTIFFFFQSWRKGKYD